MKLNIKAFALTSGIVWSLSLFIMTLWVLILGDGSNAILESFGTFYMGYDISYQGAFFGLINAFICGLICGAVFSWVYNWFVQKFS